MRRPQQPLEWAKERQAVYQQINSLAENPETVKDATILWLSINLNEALVTLAKIRAAAR